MPSGQTFLGVLECSSPKGFPYLPRRYQADTGLDTSVNLSVRSVDKVVVREVNSSVDVSVTGEVEVKEIHRTVDIVRVDTCSVGRGVDQVVTGGVVDLTVETVESSSMLADLVVGLGM